MPARSEANGTASADPPRLPNLPLPPDPDLALPDIYVPPRVSSHDPFDIEGDVRRRPRPPVGERDQDRPLPAAAVALARSAPCLLAAAVAVAGRLASGFLPASELPVVLLLIVATQIVGFLVSRSNDLWPWARTFGMNAAIVLVVLPLLAIQTATTHAPYVAAEFGTVRPAILATVAAVVGLFVCAAAAVALAWEAPADAALLFLPPGLLVPAMLATPPGASEMEVAGLVAEAFGLAAVATCAALMVRSGWRLLVGTVSLGLYFGFLLLVDRGPMKASSSDEVARILDGSLVAVAIVLTIAVPLIAAACRRVMREVQAAERASLYERIVHD